MRTLVLASLALGLLAAPVSANEFPLWQMGRGDYGFRDVCPQGTAIVGFHLRTGAWFDAIGVNCGTILPGGQTRVMATGATHGGGGGSPAEMMCENGQVVSALKFGESNDGKKLAKLVMWCKAVATGQVSDPIVFSGQEGHIYNRPNYFQDCGGEAATGLKGRFGRDVNALGLICGPYTPAPAGSAPVANGGREVSCGQFFAARSLGGGPSVVLQFHNGTGATRTLLWFNGQGKLTRYADIGAGQTFPQQTFASHMWEIRAGNGDCVMIYQAGSVSETVEIR